MNSNNKVIVLVVGAVFALIVVGMVVRFVVLSEYGVSSPILYLGLPIGGISVVLLLLLRLGLLHFGDRTGTGHHWQQPGGWQAPPQNWQQPGGWQAPSQPSQQPGGAPMPPQPWQQPGGAPIPPPAVAPPPAPTFGPPSLSVSQRLQELETLRATGAISDTEYAAKRQEIISTI
jgi:hypothetical protein